MEKKQDYLEADIRERELDALAECLDAEDEIAAMNGLLVGIDKAGAPPLPTRPEIKRNEIKFYEDLFLFSILYFNFLIHFIARNQSDL